MVGVFIQDSWSPSKKLTLNIGFRYDHQEGIIPKQGQERTAIFYGGKTYDPSVDKTFKALIWNTFSPRLGVAYSLDNAGKTVVKASFGRYYEPALSQWFIDANPNGSISWRQRLNPDWTLQGDPYLFKAAAEAKIDPDLKVPYLDEFTAGIEREIMKDMKAGLRYIRKSDRNLIEDVDMNSLDLDALKRGELVWTNYTPYSVIDPFDGQSVTFWGVQNSAITFASNITNPPDAKRDYDAVEVTLNKKYSNNWQLAASYVYAKSKNMIDLDARGATDLYNNPNSLINAYGKSALFVPHQFKLQGSYTGPFGINISGYFLYLAGQRYTRTIRSSDLGLNLAQGVVTIYAEEKSSRKYPDQGALDLRIGKIFDLPRKLGRLELILDCFNVFNANTTTKMETLSSSPLFTFEKTLSIVQPRMLRLGVRIEF
jgi:hypothetical protein